MVEPIRSVCVFCASSEAVAPGYRAVAAELGRAIAAEGWELVYGGGSIGLMGEVARAALTAGAHVTGVIPHRLADREIALHEVSELVRTDTMRERKAVMDERSDAFVVLPGGIGTLEELVEMLTLKQLGYHNRAIVVLDTQGYWDPLLAQIARMVAERFVSPHLVDLWQVRSTVAETVAALRAYTPPPYHPGAPAELEAIEGPRTW
ncbi:MAG TPA: TIGR00730 family Rossman fold protein [Egibacteraceae bacterium]|nr:TIGR00730 family Rossman fold protein [Egibacteraceae bacterium]